MDVAHNAVPVGGPGHGKTHLATAISVAAITRHGKRVRFYSTVDLVNALEQEKVQDKAGRLPPSTTVLEGNVAWGSPQRWGLQLRRQRRQNSKCGMRL